MLRTTRTGEIKMLYEIEVRDADGALCTQTKTVGSMNADLIWEHDTKTLTSGKTALYWVVEKTDGCEEYTLLKRLQA